MKVNETLPPIDRPEDFWAEAERLGRAVIGQLEYFEALGVEGFPPSVLPPPPARPVAARAPKSPPPHAAPRLKSVPATAAARIEGNESPGPAEWASQASSLAELSDQVDRCQGCPLAALRSRPPAFGRGGATPRVAVVGPTPAIYEPEPMKLLSGMVEKVLGLTPEEYYVTSLVKCSLPGEEPPPPAADHNCRPILLRELALMSPAIVVALGRTAGQHLSGSKDHLRLLRPKTHSVRGLPGPWLRVTYGLEDLLDNQDLKMEAWKDLQKIKLALQRIENK